MTAQQTLFNAYFWWEDTSRTLFEGKKKSGAKWLKIRWWLKFVFEVTYEIIADFVNTNFSGIKLYWIWKLWKIKISATRKLSLLTKLLTSKKLWALKKSFFGKKKEIFMYQWFLTSLTRVQVVFPILSQIARNLAPNTEDCIKHTQNQFIFKSAINILRF